MGHFLYPSSWQQLGQVPSSRSDLIYSVKDLIQWNDTNGEIKKVGAESTIDFLFNVYNMHEGVDKLSGELVFSDEIKPLEHLIGLFYEFLEGEWEKERVNQEALYDVILPDPVVKAARALYEKLKERCLPEWVENGNAGQG